MGIAYGAALTWWLLQQSPGTERMQEISRAVQEGASAYLRRQYTTIAGVAAVIFLVIGFWNDLGWATAFGFLIGAVFSAAAGFIGMNVAVRANTRVAEGAKSGDRARLQHCLPCRRGDGPPRRRPRPPRRRGLLRPADGGRSTRAPKTATEHLIGLAFGGSLISVFARLGGGIFTKAADVGADLVGKLEAGIPEDDPRNPAVIADNVGDNVGDCAGMAADLFETYAVTAVAVMFLAALRFPAADLVAFPLVIGGIAIIASVIGTLFARVGRGGGIMTALYKAVFVAAILSAIGFIPDLQGVRERPVQLLGSVRLLADRPRRDRPARRDHRVLHGHALAAGEGHLAAPR